jgi:hypothetical protein
MYANERPSNYGANPSKSYRQNHSDRESPPEETLRTEKLQVERKSFVLTLKENARGKFLRITEDVNGRRANIIIPSTGLDEFADLVAVMADAALEEDELEAEQVERDDAEGQE